MAITLSKDDLVRSGWAAWSVKKNKETNKNNNYSSENKLQTKRQQQAHMEK